MAMLSSMKNHTSSNYSVSSEGSLRQNTTASAYVVDTATSALTGFHYTTSGAGGRQDWCGAFEVPSGIPSPPTSPRIHGRRISPVRRNSSDDGDAAHNITEECERLFCETLRTVFLVEKNTAAEDSLVMDANSDSMGEHTTTRRSTQPVPLQKGSGGTIGKHGLPTPAASPGTLVMENSAGLVKAYLEMHDYAIDTTFRGFIAEKEEMRAMFVFFNQDAVGQDLKPGLTALLELCSTEGLDCEHLVVCVSRNAAPEDTADLVKDLGWVGFELASLDAWTGVSGSMSEQWILLAMDV